MIRWRPITADFALRPRARVMRTDDFVRWRSAMGMTQREVADYLAYSVDAVRAFEQGKRKIPEFMASYIRALAAKAEFDEWCRISPEFRQWAAKQRVKSRVVKRRRTVAAGSRDHRGTAQRH